MANPKELRKYRRRAQEAAETLALVEALPRRVGSLIQWGENGLIWQRVGDDAWVALHEVYGYVPQPQGLLGYHPSDHVARVGQGWKRISQLPPLDPEADHG